MKKIEIPIAVCSRTFSKHPILREELFSKFSNVVFNDSGKNLQDIELVSFLKNKVAALVALEKINDDVLSQLPELKLISKYGVGLDNLDLDAMKKRGVQLGWTGGVNRRSVSELALQFILGSIRGVYFNQSNVKKGEWKYEGGDELSSKTVGIIGCGYIGKDLVELLKPFQCKILVNDILDLKSFCVEKNITQVTKEEIYKSADVISLHVPATNETKNMINEAAFNLMKPSAVLINTARGSIIEEVALKKALRQNQIKGAAVDVLQVEPPTDLELISLNNLYVTSHIGGSSKEGILAMGRSAIENLIRLI